MPRARRLTLATVIAVAVCGSVVAFGACNLSNGSPSRRSGGGKGAKEKPAPKVTITSPARASWHAPGDVVVEGTAVDTISPIQGVFVNGTPVTLNADGTFRATTRIDPGMNTISAWAENAKGGLGVSTIGVIAAAHWRDPSQASREGGQGRVNDAALDAIGAIIENVLVQTDLQTILMQNNPLYAQDVLGLAAVNVSVTSFVFSDLRFTVDATSSGVWIRGEFQNPVIGVDVLANALGIAYQTPATLLADPARLEGRFLITAKPDGTLEATGSDPSIELVGFQLQAPPGTLAAIIAPLVTGVIENLLKDTLGELVTVKLPDLIETETTAFFQSQQPIDIFGKPLRLNFGFDWIRYDDAGITFSLGVLPIGGTVAAPITTAGGAPGGYCTAGTPPLLPVGPRGVYACVDDDALNHVLHVAWAGGVMDIDLDAAFLAQFGVTLPIDLTAGSLYTILSELKGVTEPDDPIALKIRPHLPPIVAVAGQPDLLDVGLGEVHLDLTIDRGDGAGPEVFLRTIVQVELGMSVDLTPQGISLGASVLPRFFTEVVEEPIADFNNEKVEVLVSLILTPAIPTLLHSVKDIAIPYLGQLSTINVDAYADGPSLDFVTVLADLHR